MHDKLEYPNYLEPIARSKSSNVEVFKDFVRMSVCALSAWSREEDYLEVAGRYSKTELGEISKAFGSLTSQMQEHPFDDLLGVYYQDIASKSTRDNRGEFYTPPTISHLMAQIVFNAEAVIEWGSPVTINEPAVWSGGMILEMARQLAPKEKGYPSYVDLMRVTASDISPTACDMSLINFTLWGIPAEVYHQNTLSWETWGHWQNIHWHRVGENQRRAYEEISRKILNPQPENKEHEVMEPILETTQPRADVEIPKREGKGGQIEFDL